MSIDGMEWRESFCAHVEGMALMGLDCKLYV